MDGDAFEPPSPVVESGAGGRQWSSLKSSASPPAATEEDRERAKSLPAYGPTSHSPVYLINPVSVSAWSFKCSKSYISECQLFVLTVLTHF